MKKINFKIMIEGRGIIKDIESAKKKIEEIGGMFKGFYSFTDVIFVFNSGKEKFNKELSRLRIYKINNWPTKDIVLIHKIIDWKGDSKLIMLFQERSLTQSKKL